MAWAIITRYTSKCAQMDPQHLLKTSKFYSRSKKCDIKKTLGDGYHPLGSPKVNEIFKPCQVYECKTFFISLLVFETRSSTTHILCHPLPFLLCNGAVGDDVIENKCGV